MRILLIKIITYELILIKIKIMAMSPNADEVIKTGRNHEESFWDITTSDATYVATLW